MGSSKKIEKTDLPKTLSGMFAWPDPITSPEMLSGAVFLYFKKQLILTSPPLILVKEPYELLDLIGDRKPPWTPVFFHFVRMWRKQVDGCRKVEALLKPLKKKFINVYVSYPATCAALDDAENLASSSKMSLDSMAELINVANASGEIIRHIMLEMFIENDKDIEALFQYCDDMFKKQKISHLLTKAYLLRLKLLKGMHEKELPVLLTNERLSKFLFSLPVEAKVERAQSVDRDVISWELFRQILSPRLDPLNAERVEFIAELLSSRSNEIERLRSKCLSLAEQCEEPISLERLAENTEKVIKKHVKKEIEELLELDRKSLENFFIALFSDEKTWMAIVASITGIIYDKTGLSAGAAIAALCNIGAKAFKEAANRHEKVKQSDFGLVYTMTHSSKLAKG